MLEGPGREWATMSYNSAIDYSQLDARTDAFTSNQLSHLLKHQGRPFLQVGGMMGVGKFQGMPQDMLSISDMSTTFECCPHTNVRRS